MVAAQPPTPDISESPARSAGHDLLTDAATALDAAGISWARLRPRGDSNEDDLLIEDGAWRRIEAALATAGFVGVRRLGRGSHRAFHAFDPATGWWWKLDLVTRIDLGRYQERRTVLAGPFLERRRQSPGASEWTLAPGDAFFALLLHDLFDRDSATIRHGEELARLAAQLDPEAAVAADVRRLLPAGMAPAELVRRARVADAAGLERFGTAMRRGSRSPTTCLRSVTAKVLRRVDRLDPPFVRRGLAVALLGPDGAGKSTLGTTFAAGGPLPVRTVYLGLYGGRSATARPRRLPIPGIGLAGRIARMWRGWLVGRWHVVRGRIVVFDRHPLEARMAPLDGRRPSLGRRIVGRSLPVPELVVVLDAPAATLFARKPEHPLETIEAMRAGYLGLARRLRQAVEIDVQGPPTEVAHRVTALGWEWLAARVRSRAGR